jgi:MFS family permease
MEVLSRLPSMPNVAQSYSPLSALRHSAFRGLWIGSAVLFTGGSMQVMAASWLMIQLTRSSFLAALVQTAIFLPMFILALPAGVLADTMDRRRLILNTLSVQAVLLFALAVSTFLGWTGPAALLLLTFAAGCCGAFFSPAWNTSVVETVPHEEIPHAITAMAISWNCARALGPSIAGLVFAWLGAGWVFTASATGVLVMIYAVRRWPPAPHAKTTLPAERLWSGTVAGLRYARHSPMIFAQLLRTAAYSGAGSALWALLPAIAANNLHMDAAGFGVLVGCLGSGAVLAGVFLGKVRARFGLDLQVTTGCIVFAGAMVIVAFVRVPIIVFGVLAVAGAAWMAVMATFTTATQASAPPWVRSRAVAMQTISALGSFALGSAFWGAVSDIAGLSVALSAAALALVSGIFLARRFPLRMGTAGDITPVVLWEEIFIKEAPLPDDGPVSVELGYRIDAGDAQEFLQAAMQLRAVRRRDGASLWRMYRDLGDSTRYVERFIIPSWAEYLHQRARATLADQEVETNVRKFLCKGEAVTTQHYIAEL